MDPVERRRLRWVWSGMIDRCRNENNAGYHKYGARDIRVCASWEASFHQFLADMGPRPSREYSIERRNNDGHYEPGNCYWATRHIQANNCRTNHFVDFDGKRLTIAQWERHLGFPDGALKQRLANGWPVDRAMRTAVRRSKRINNQMSRDRILEIKALATGKPTEQIAIIAERFGIGTTTVRRIVAGEGAFRGLP